MNNQTNVFGTLQTLNTGIRKETCGKFDMTSVFYLQFTEIEYCEFRYLLNAKKTCIQLEGIPLLALKINTWIIQKRFPRQSFYQNNFYLV